MRDYLISLLLIPVLASAALPQALNPNVVTNDYIEYSRRGSLGSKDYVATGFDSETFKKDAVKLISTNASEVITQKGPEITPSLEARGITYESNGYEENGAVEIGKDAKSLVTDDAVNSAPNNTKIRNVGIAIGTRAEAIGSSSVKNQSIAIGYSAKSVGSNAVAIGGGARHFDDENDDNGNNAYANGSTSLAIGYGVKAIGTGATAIGAASSGTQTSARADGAVALGVKARSMAERAVQIGDGINNTPNSLQFQGVMVVKDGKVQGSFNPSDLDPKSFNITNDTDITAYPHVINSIDPEDYLKVGIEVGVNPLTTRNYELFIPNNEFTREGLPLVLENELPAGMTCLYRGDQYQLRFPVMIKVTQPTSKVVIITPEYIADGYTDWAPVITNVNIRYDAVNHKYVTPTGLKSIEGYNLHCATNITIRYEGTNTHYEYINPTGTDEYIGGTLYPYASVSDFQNYDADGVYELEIFYHTKLGSYHWIGPISNLE